MKAGPRNGSRRAAQPFLLRPESTALALFRVPLSCVRALGLVRLGTAKFPFGFLVTYRTGIILNGYIQKKEPRQGDETQRFGRFSPWGIAQHTRLHFEEGCLPRFACPLTAKRPRNEAEGKGDSGESMLVAFERFNCNSWYWSRANHFCAGEQLLSGGDACSGIFLKVNLHGSILEISKKAIVCHELQLPLLPEPARAKCQLAQILLPIFHGPASAQANRYVGCDLTTRDGTMSQDFQPGEVILESLYFPFTTLELEGKIRP